MKRFFILLFLLILSTPQLSAQNTPTAQLIAFTASEVKSNVKIQWSTSLEANVKEFFVYRSIDKQNWFVVGVYPSKKGGLIKNYDFIDITANGGMNYYKLEAVGEDGQRTELRQSEIEMEDKEKAVYVYWETELVRIKLKAGSPFLNIQLELTDVIGRTYPVNFVRDNSHEITIITGELNRGAYFLKCDIDGKRTVRRKAVF